MDNLHTADFGCHEVSVRRLSVVLLVLLVAFFLFPRESSCEFYKYVDKDGKTHYVDSKTKIPKEYRKDLTTYEEKYDHLSEEERQEKIAEDRRTLEQERKEKEERRRQQARQLEDQQRRERVAEEERLADQREAMLEERREKERKEREAFTKQFETKVLVNAYGQVLVPCTLVYGKREIEVNLLLDTGCSVTTLHDSIAKKLGIKGGKKGKSYIAGGGTLGYKSATLDSFKVGPHKVEEFSVYVIKHKGRKSPMMGLLGMNFLAGREYKIDYINRVIRWVP